MPPFLNRIFSGASQKDTIPVNTFEGITSDGRVVLRDRRGTSKAEIPIVDEKGFIPGDPLANYTPTGAKEVSAAKAMGQFRGGTFAAVNAIGSEVANIQLRLYRVNGNDHE